MNYLIPENLKDQYEPVPNGTVLTGSEGWFSNGEFRRTINREIYPNPSTSADGVRYYRPIKLKKVDMNPITHPDSFRALLPGENLIQGDIFHDDPRGEWRTSDLYRPRTQGDSFLQYYRPIMNPVTREGMIHYGNPETHPQNFTQLRPGETIQEGDLTQYPMSGWVTTHDAGRILCKHDAQYYRPITQTKKEPMKEYYRLLPIGESYGPEHGDMLVQGGRRADIVAVNHPGDVMNGIILRPVQVDEWISVKDCMPAAQDYSPTWKIHFIFADGQQMLYGKTDVPTFDVTHWRRVAPPVKFAPPITINVGDKDEEVRVENGYLKIGCKTVKTSPETLRKIADKLEKK